MDAMQDFLASLFGGNLVIVGLLLAAAVFFFAWIGILAVVGKSNPKKNNDGRRTLKALLLGGLAIVGPVLYEASSKPEFVQGLDRILDGCQAKLREIVVSTASVRDDAVLDAIDAVLDGFQERLREEVLSRTKRPPESRKQNKNGKY